MENFAIEQHAVLGLAVVAEPLAVIAAQDDQRWIVQPAFVEIREEPPDDRICRGDLAVVRTRCVLRSKRFHWLVRRVRLEQMEKKEEWLRLHAIEPAEGCARGDVAGALQRA